MSDEEQAPKRRPKKKKSSQEKMGFEKYVEYYSGSVSKYTLAYLQPKYRATMKTKDEWDAIVAPYIN